MPIVAGGTLRLEDRATLAINSSSPHRIDAAGAAATGEPAGLDANTMLVLTIQVGQMLRSELPSWAFEASLHLARSRADSITNRFHNERLRELHRAEGYLDHVESVAGYMGEIGAAAALGMDPKTAMLAMIVDTNGMTRRDFGDLHHRGWSIDVKVEDYGRSHDAVIGGRVRRDRPFGCRLVNLAQFRQNGKHVDHYLFGVFDPPLGPTRRLHEARRIAWVGCADRQTAAAAPHGLKTPAGGTLKEPAKFIAHASLLPSETLMKLPTGSRLPCGTPPTAREAKRIEQISRMLLAIT